MQTSRIIARAQNAKTVVKIQSIVTCVACATGKSHKDERCGYVRGIRDNETYTLFREVFNSYEEAWDFAVSHAPMGETKLNKKGFHVAKGNTPYGMTVKLITKKAS